MPSAMSGSAALTAQEIIEQLKPLGLDSYKSVMMKHGVPEPILGVKIEELKKFQRKIKKDYQLSKDLYDTGIYDAMYLAGLIADETKMTAEDLESWLHKATCGALVECTVAWVAAESAHGWDLALKWIESDNEDTATAGWSTLSSLLAYVEDTDLDMDTLRALLSRVRETIHSQPNRVKYHMNSFVISVGGYVAPLAEEALRTADAIGKVSVELVGGCKLPVAPEYIRKMWAREPRFKKRKTVRC